MSARRPRRRGLPRVPLSECRDCALPIIFGTTPNGRQMPLNCRPNPRGNVAAQLVGGRLHVRVLTKDEPALRGMEERYMPHAATCPERADAPKVPRQRDEPDALF